MLFNFELSLLIIQDWPDLTHSPVSVLYFYSMATQLTQVVEQMTRANENLSYISSKNAKVQDVAALWRESYTSSRHLSAVGAGEGETGADSSNAEREHSSLFASENRL
jgi:hypothetical protein